MTLLTARDVTDLVYDLGEVSIFFERPMTIEIPGHSSFEVGSGLGGFSWSLFTRGSDCNLCGNCCKNTHRRVWFWWEGEQHPESAIPFELKINGNLVKIWLHINSDKNGMTRCDFLQPLPELPMLTLHGEQRIPEGCSLHESSLKPNHCRTHPQTGVYRVKTVSGHRGLLSRRLPSRNWRWPDCPIDIKSLPLTADQILTDAKMWATWNEALCYLPESRVLSAYTLWREMVSSTPPSTYVLFENSFSKIYQPTLISP